MDYSQAARNLVMNSGGAENITSVTHCATRLRFVLKDKDKADTDAIQKEPGVLGCIYSAGQLQIILGKEILPVYDAVVKAYNFSGSSSPDTTTEKKPLTIGSALDAVIGYVASAVTPLVPGLIGGGMLKVLLLLISYISPSFTASPTFRILGWVANAPFYFMPIFVAYGAAVKLGATPIYAMAGAASLLTPEFTAIVAKGEALTLLSVPVRLVRYPQQLLPALLIALAAYHIEKFLNKIVPGIFKSIFVGSGTMGLSMILGFIVLGPLGSYVGSAISGAFVFLGNNAGSAAVAVLAACLPWLVMTGMHHAISPFMAQSIANPGYDPIFRPAFILHNMAEGGACLGVGLRTKNPAFRSETFSLAFGCIVAGVTEPAIYGVNFRLRKPMIGVMAGGAVGGLVAGFMGARAYSMGYSTVMALPIFENTILAMTAGIVVAIITAAVVTFIIGFNENEGQENADLTLRAVADGEMIDLADVHDDAFSQKLLGDGVAFIPENGKICSPCKGVIEMLADTGHAFGVRREDGLSVLVHIGIDTVKEKGEGFKAYVKEGQKVRAGQPVMLADIEALKAKGYDMTTMLIITEEIDSPVKFKDFGKFSAGDIISA